jgi:hypothetical protein
MASKRAERLVDRAERLALVDVLRHRLITGYDVEALDAMPWKPEAEGFDAEVAAASSPLVFRTNASTSSSTYVRFFRNAGGGG